MAEMPLMASSSYASNTLGHAELMAQLNMAQVMQRAGQASGNAPQAVPPIRQQPATQKEAAMARRLIQVFIADPDENVPLDACLLYSGEQKITDLTDQELFFEIDIRSILEQHNAKRADLVNKSVKERVEKLEPARIRDLKMTVVTIATF